MSSTCWRKASATHTGVAQGRLIAPVHRSVLCAVSFLNAGISAFEPSLHDRGVLFVGSFDRLMRCKTPTGEVLAHAASLQLNAEFLLIELTDSRVVAKVKGHLELLGTLVDDYALDGIFLHLTEHAAMASGRLRRAGQRRTSRLLQTDRSQL